MDVRKLLQSSTRHSLVVQGSRFLPKRGLVVLEQILGPSMFLSEAFS